MCSNAFNKRLAFSFTVGYVSAGIMGHILYFLCVVQRDKVSLYGKKRGDEEYVVNLLLFLFHSKLQKVKVAFFLNSIKIFLTVFKLL